LRQSEVRIFTISCFVDVCADCGTKGGVRTFGFYSTFEEADKAVRENRCDLSEYTYNYAVIEEVPEGIHSFAQNRWVYKFNDSKKTFEPIDEPEEIKHFSNFSMG